ncbi:MAG: hypothetical protein KDJ47_02800 [Hyphomicrobiaceae bacterium]|nr:hypothetical protein [Hyphomicrobiaceae bacterium]
MSYRKLGTAAAVAALSLALALPAHAKCTRLGFSVNDYGKDGPTNDAKRLLDTYIAKWASENGISKYRTGKKDVTCELFLNLIVVDEHTCKAEADVCWNEGGGKTSKPVSAAVPAAEPSGATVKNAAAKPQLTAKPKVTATAKKAGAEITTGTIEKAAPEAAKAKAD